MAVFCDLRKAFDTVNHGKLLKKLQKYGIKGLAFSWFKSYLTDRKQFVHINNLNSPLLEITIGVPQGSILGPILFLLYINDLPDASLLKALLFADDTTLLAAHEDLEELCRFVNSELKKITDYFRCNLLSLHPTKTKYILFTTKNNLNTENCRLYINNNNSGLPCNNLLITEIDRIAGPENQAVRFLGVYTDPHLNFNYYVKHIGKRLSTSLFFLNKAKNLLNERALKALYYSLIHTHIIYAIQIWSSCSQNNINYILKLQKKAIRIINHANYNAHTESLFKKCNILPLPDLIYFFKVQFMQQFSNGFLPNIFTEVWTTNAARALGNIHGYPLRNSENLYIPPARLASTEKHPLHLFPRLWADLNENQLKFIRDKNEFNSKFKKFLLNKLKSNFKCSRLFCPSCHQVPGLLDSD